MQNKKPRYIRFLIFGLVTALLPIFLLVKNATDIEATEESVTFSSMKGLSDESKKTPDQFTSSKVSLHGVVGIEEEDHQLVGASGLPSTKDELKIAKTLPRLQLDLRLAGTVLVGKESAYALIVEDITGRQNLYRVGESIKGAKLLKIDTDSVVFEKEGESYIFKVMGGNFTVPTPSEIQNEHEPLFTGAPAKLPFFEPFFSKTGPPVADNVHVEELPLFEPIINSTGPPVDPEDLYENLPEFVPFESNSGPPDV